MSRLNDLLRKTRPNRDLIIEELEEDYYPGMREETPEMPEEDLIVEPIPQEASVPEEAPPANIAEAARSIASASSAELAEEEMDPEAPQERTGPTYEERLMDAYRKAADARFAQEALKSAEMVGRSIGGTGYTKEDLAGFDQRAAAADKLPEQVKELEKARREQFMDDPDSPIAQFMKEKFKEENSELVNKIDNFDQLTLRQLNEISSLNKKGVNYSFQTLETAQGPMVFAVNPNDPNDKKVVGRKGYAYSVTEDAEGNPLVRAGNQFIPLESLLGKNAKDIGKGISKPGEKTKEEKESEKDQGEKFIYENASKERKESYETFRKEYRKDSEATRTTLSKLETIFPLIEGATKTESGASSLGAQVALLYEDGRLTDEDVKRYTQRNAIVSTLKDYYQTLMSGKISTEKADDIRKTLKIYKTALERRPSFKAYDASRAFNKRYGLTNYDVFDLASQFNPDFNKKYVEEEHKNQSSSVTGEDTVRLRNKETGKIGRIPKKNLENALKTGRFEKVE